MNVLYLVNDVIEPDSGVSKKIFAQSSALRNLANSYYFVQTASDFRSRIVNEQFKVFESRFAGKYFFRYCFHGLMKYISSLDLDVIYIRYTHFSSPAFLCFISKIKKMGIKVIIEIPTFPYDTEYSGLGVVSHAKLAVDKVFRRYLKKYVDLCVTFTEFESNIFSIDTLQISNALDTQLIEDRYFKLSRLSSPKLNKKTVVFTAVASMYYWHGYDRFINAMSRYLIQCKSDELVFNLVGEGDELPRLKQLVKEKGLNRQVIFHGHLVGEDLENILLQTDVGVDSLGRFRSGNEFNNSLKSKEYLSYGLPVIKSHRDSSIDDLGYVYSVSNDEQDIDLVKFMEWYKTNSRVFDCLLINEMCLKRFSWDKQLAAVFKFISIKA